MKRLRRALLIINLKTAVVTACAIVSTSLCRRFGVTADLHKQTPQWSGLNGPQDL